MTEVLRELERIARDDVSGATDLTLRAADLLLRALAAGRAGPVIEGLLAAKPMMAPLLNLACLARGEPGAAAVRVQAFRDSLAGAPSGAAREAVRPLERPGTGPWTVLTLSASRVVEETLLALAHSGAVTSVVVAESRPRLEGATLARRLAALGGPRVAVTYDAALPGLCTPESLVILGADAVLPGAFVNKSGSLALCLAAREAGARVLVVTTTHKVLRPEALPYFHMPHPDPGDRGAKSALNFHKSSNIHDICFVSSHHPGAATSKSRRARDRDKSRDSVVLPRSGRRVAGGDDPVFLDIQFEHVPLRLVEAVVTEEGPRT